MWETLPYPIGEDACHFLGEEKLTLPTHPLSRVSTLVCCVYICGINYYMQFLAQGFSSVSLKNFVSYKPQSEPWQAPLLRDVHPDTPVSGLAERTLGFVH